MQYEYEPTPEQLAEEFCKLYQEGHVRFLNKVSEIFNSPGNSLAMQLEYITQEKNLSYEARFLMSRFGEYAYHNYEG